MDRAWAPPALLPASASSPTSVRNSWNQSASSPEQSFTVLWNSGWHSPTPTFWRCCCSGEALTVEALVVAVVCTTEGPSSEPNGSVPASSSLSSPSESSPPFMPSLFSAAVFDEDEEKGLLEVLLLLINDDFLSSADLINR